MIQILGRGERRKRRKQTLPFFGRITISISPGSGGPIRPSLSGGGVKSENQRGGGERRIGSVLSLFNRQGEGNEEEKRMTRHPQSWDSFARLPDVAVGNFNYPSWGQG